MVIARQNGQKWPMLGMNFDVPKTWQNDSDHVLMFIYGLENHLKLKLFVLSTKQLRNTPGRGSAVNGYFWTFRK